MTLTEQPEVLAPRVQPPWLPGSAHGTCSEYSLFPLVTFLLKQMGVWGRPWKKYNVTFKRQGEPEVRGPQRAAHGAFRELGAKRGGPFFPPPFTDV